jgi:hypothetical protein
MITSAEPTSSARAAIALLFHMHLTSSSSPQREPNPRHQEREWPHSRPHLRQARVAGRCQPYRVNVAMSLNGVLFACADWAKPHPLAPSPTRGGGMRSYTPLSPRERGRG